MERNRVNLEESKKAYGIDHQVAEKKVKFQRRSSFNS